MIRLIRGHTLMTSLQNLWARWSALPMASGCIWQCQPPFTRKQTVSGRNETLWSRPDRISTNRDAKARDRNGVTVWFANHVSLEAALVLALRLDRHCIIRRRSYEGGERERLCRCCGRCKIGTAKKKQTNRFQDRQETMTLKTWTFSTIVALLSLLEVPPSLLRPTSCPLTRLRASLNRGWN